MAQKVTREMTDQRRALLTEREREILSNDADVTDNYRYSVESRIRTRLRDRLGKDIEVIRKFYPEMYDDVVYPNVCQSESATSEEGDESREDRVDTGEGSPTPTEPPTSSAPLEQQIRDTLEDLDITGRGAETQEVRRDAIAFAWEQLRDAGEATTQELANAAFDEYADHPKFGYSRSENHYRGYTFWDSCAREIMQQLPGVESPPQRGNTWRFDGGDSSEDGDIPTNSGVYDPTEEF